MTDDDPQGQEKTFGDALSPEEKRFYSVNFLLARFASGDGEPPAPESLLASRHYGSRDFAVAPFYKDVSTPLSRFAPAATPAAGAADDE
jgi:hypothetical protein